MGRYEFTTTLLVDHNHHLGGLLSSDHGRVDYHNHYQVQSLQIFINLCNFQFFHSIEQLYFYNTKLVSKREFCQEKACKMTQNLTQNTTQRVVYQPCFLYFTEVDFWLHLWLEGEHGCNWVQGSPSFVVHALAP